MIKSLVYILTLVAVIFLSACSSKPHVQPELTPNVRDRFTTEIKDNGLKLFTYQVWQINKSSPSSDESLQRPIIRSKEQLRELRKAQRAKEQRYEMWQQQIEIGLVHTLEKSHFCQTGYIEIDRFIGEIRAEIRGECKEGADEG